MRTGHLHCQLSTINGFNYQLFYFCTDPRSRYDNAMSDDYRQLLDATIQHLEGLKSRGARHVAVAPETLRALALPAKPQIANLKAPSQPVPVAPAPAQSAIRNPQSAIAT